MFARYQESLSLYSQAGDPDEGQTDQHGQNQRKATLTMVGVPFPHGTSSAKEAGASDRSPCLDPAG